jgi:large subunit ribosomal protein L3
VFSAGDLVDVTGRSKGRGFSGVVRRYKFAGQTATHGTHESFRGPGGIGACAYPGRVFKGKKMPGQMGALKRTIQNLTVVAVRSEDEVILLKGGVPGARNGRVLIRPAVKG